METYTFYGDEMDVRKTSMGNNRIYVTYYTFWSKIVLMEAIPYGVILFLNIIIVSKIFESIQFRKKFKQRDDAGNDLNKDDNITTETPLLRPPNRRRQSSPILTQLTTGDHNSICYLSSSNLRSNDGNRFQTPELNSSSGVFKVNRKLLEK